MERCPDSALWQICQGELTKVQGRTPIQGAEQGDEASLRVLERYREALALGLINLINILQPEIICLGGGVSNAREELLLKPLEELMRQGSYDKNSPTRLVRAALGNDAGVVGAALLCRSL